VRRFNAREQRFLLGRGVLGLYNRTAVLLKLSAGETAELVAQSVRIHAPAFALLGRRNDEAIKQLRKLYSGKTLRALELPSSELAASPRVDVAGTVQALAHSADRAGLLVCGDPVIALSLVMREDLNVSNARPEGPELQLEAVRQRGDLQALIKFAVSEDFFRLRQRMGPAL
jgi:hypothetical protein